MYQPYYLQELSRDIEVAYEGTIIPILISESEGEEPIVLPLSFVVMR